MSEFVETVRGIVREELATFRDGLEERLADAMTKALDTVEGENRRRIRTLEEDVSDLLRWREKLEEEDDG